MHLQRAHCSRSLLVALKSASKLVYQTGVVYDVVKFACENYRDNYFLLRVSFFAEFFKFHFLPMLQRPF